MAEISKMALDPDRHRRPVFRFERARTALRQFLEALELARGSTVLLPSYIGWSKNEGSGVLDPIQDAGLRFAFYRMGRDLAIDLADLEARLAEPDVRVAVFIHYFGRPDPQLEAAVAVARRRGAVVIEDEAHAYFSDVVSGACGRLGDAALYSFHKMFPTTTGGGIALNGAETIRRVGGALATAAAQGPALDPGDYDLVTIAARRRENGARLAALVEGVPGIRPLWQGWPEGAVPQTFPIVVERGDRDRLYDEMNGAGFGVVSLYHTLVEPIRERDFPDAHWLSRRAMNLPVHQDVDPAAMAPMMERLRELVGGAG